MLVLTLLGVMDYVYISGTVKTINYYYYYYYYDQYDILEHRFGCFQANDIFRMLTTL